jgi:hypothetical protein
MTRMRTLATSLSILALASAAPAWETLTGQEARPIQVDEGLNASEGQTLEDLRGKVVLLEFWATW